MKRNICVICIILCAIATRANANVLFSEIAWMGTTESSFNEWMELYNDGDTDQSLNGWNITNGDDINIQLSGTISAGKYYLIERTDDNTLKTVTADLVAVFGHGLSNTGDNLYLKNDTGSLIDSLLYSAGWPAGDVGSKQTMQKDGSSWTTANPSPKSGNLSQQSTTQNNASSTVSNVINSNSANIVASQIKKDPPPKPKEIIIISAPKIVGTNLPLSISAKAYDASSQNIDTGYFIWSMGDGHTVEQKNIDKVKYTYDHFGTFIISINYFISKNQFEYGIDPIYTGDTTIKVIPNDISISQSGDSVIIKNKSVNDIDLSKWKIIDSDKTFTLPFGFKIANKSDITLDQKILGFIPTSPALYTKDGAIISSVGIVEQKPDIVQSSVKSQSNTTKTLSYKKYPDTTVQKDFEKDVSLNDLTANASASNIKIPKTLVVLATIFVLIIGAYIMRANKKENSSGEFSLLDE